MKTTLIATTILATLAFTPTTAEANHGRSYGGYCPPPVHYSTPRCPTPPPAVYHRPTVVGHGWGHVAPSRTVTRCDTTYYRGYNTYGGYNSYGGGYYESRQTYCRPVVTPRPVYVAPTCGPNYYRSGHGYRGTSGAITFRF